MESANATPQYRETSTKAVVSLILSLIGISIGGVIAGHMAKNDMRREPERWAGSGMATWGLVLGWIGVAGWTLWLIAFSALVAAGV